MTITGLVELLFVGFSTASLEAHEKKYIALISVITLSVLGIGGWFTYTKYEYRKTEMEYLEHSLKPSGMIGFWSQSEKPISIRVTDGDGEIRWVPLSGGAGFMGSFSAGGY